jgi:coproporphyrinogen III oxidase-like Fe-S oxidoreductase
MSSSKSSNSGANDSVFCSFDDLQEENIELRRERDRLYKLLEERIDREGGRISQQRSRANSEDRSTNGRTNNIMDLSLGPAVQHDLLSSKLKSTERDLQETRTQVLQILPLRLRLHALKVKNDSLCNDTQLLRTEVKQLTEEKAAWETEREQLMDDIKAKMCELLIYTSSLEAVLKSRTGITAEAL